MLGRNSKSFVPLCLAQESVLREDAIDNVLDPLRSRPLITRTVRQASGALSVALHIVRHDSQQPVGVQLLWIQGYRHAA